MLNLKELKSLYILYNKEANESEEVFEDGLITKKQTYEDLADEAGELLGSKQTEINIGEDAFSSDTESVFSGAISYICFHSETLLNKIDQAILILSDELKTVSNKNDLNIKIEELKENKLREIETIEKEHQMKYTTDTPYDRAKEAFENLKTNYGEAIKRYASKSQSITPAKSFWNSPYFMLVLYMFEFISIYLALYALGSENAILTVFITLTITFLIIGLSAYIGRILKQRLFNKGSMEMKFTYLFILFLAIIQIGLAAYRFDYISHLNLSGSADIQSNLNGPTTESLNNSSSSILNSTISFLFFYAINLALNLFAIAIYYYNTEENPLLESLIKKLAKAEKKYESLKSKKLAVQDKLDKKKNERIEKINNELESEIKLYQNYPQEIKVLLLKLKDLYNFVLGFSKNYLDRANENYKGIIHRYRSAYHRGGGLLTVDWNKFPVKDITYSFTFSRKS